MKGRISKELESVLRDPAAREQLRERLITGRDGQVSVGRQSFSVRTSVENSGASQNLSAARGTNHD